MKKILCAMLGLLWAIPSFANCNLLSYNTSPKTVHGVTFTPQADGSIIINGSVNDDSEYANYIVANSANNLVLPAGTYTISGITGGSLSTYILDLYGGYMSGNATADFFDTRAGDPITRTATSEWRLGMYAIRIMRGYTANNLVVRPMIEQGSTATNYVPYNPYCQNSCANLWSPSYSETDTFHMDNGVLENTETDTRASFSFAVTGNYYSSNTVNMSPYNDFSIGHHEFNFTVPNNVNGSIMFRHNGSVLDLIFIRMVDSDVLAPGTYRASFDVLANDPTTVGGVRIQNIEIKRAECVEIQIATTQHVAGAFSGLNSQLTAAIATVNSVVTNTIDQANRIAALATGKQTRPTDTCPQYRQCLLVEGTDGTPHWYEINDPFYNFFAPILATGTSGMSIFVDAGYQQLEYVQNTANNYIDTGIVARGTKWEVVANTVSTSGEGLLVAFGPSAGRYMSTVDGAWSPGINSSTFPPRGDATQKTLLTIDWTTSITKVYIDNNFIGQVDVGDAGTNENVFLLNFDNNYPFRGKLYSVRVTNASGDLIHNFIPVRRTYDSKIGLYDTVEKAFYGSSNGVFTAGPTVANDAIVPTMQNWAVAWTAASPVAAGTVYGIGKCNTSGADATPVTDSGWNTEGAKCWCKVTGLNTGGETVTTDSGTWAFGQTMNSTWDCTSKACAQSCGRQVQQYANFRAEMFNVVN